MKLSSIIVWRPVCVFITLVLLVLLLPSFGTPYWYRKVKHIEVDVNYKCDIFGAELIAQVENAARLLHPFNLSVLYLARVLSSSLNGTRPSFSKIKTRVAPLLYQALSTLPYISQISYFGSDGLFFSYYFNDNQTLAVYSNTSFAFDSSTISNSSSKYTWYTQPINRASGRLVGNAIVSDPMVIVNTSWYNETLNSENGYDSLGHRWNSEQELVLLNSASVDVMDGKDAVLSLGFSVKALSKFYSNMELNGGNLFVATKDGQMILGGIPNTRMMVIDGNDSVSLRFEKPDGVADFVGNISCKVNIDGSRNSTIMEVSGVKYWFHCSRFNLLGVQSVYVLAIPFKGLGNLVHETYILALMMQVFMVIVMVISITVFVALIVKGAKKEMHLCVALIKQMESTRQAERKHLNKSLAFANANHDVRASLAGINGLIELSKYEVPRGSEVETNLRQMETCTKELSNIVNSILDTSKIEAGKMDLNEEDFDIAELLEDVVDMYHPVGMKKGIDVILDPCDGSIMKNALVKGDRIKLKQILWNLMSNAVKFTTEGNISVRAVAKKPSNEQSIIASQKNGFLSCFSCFFLKSGEALETVNTVMDNPNTMEFTFEVDDTGKGVPKEKQKLVFENYVQVKETAQGTGTGLGLGIVQSMVRLMGGEIEIVDKENGERGTCFKFNAFLVTLTTSTTSSESACFYEHGLDEDNNDIEKQAGSLFPNQQQNHGGSLMPICSPSPRLNGSSSSHIILLIKSDERRRVVYKFMESIGIKVYVAKQWESFPHVLKKIKRKLQIISSYSSSGKSDWSSKSERSYNSSVGAKDVPLSSMDGTDHVLPVYRRGTRLNFVLIVLEACSGPFSEMCRLVSDFRNDLRNGGPSGSYGCKIVWLDNPTSRIIPQDERGCKGSNGLISRYDHLITKPFHGSRIYQVIRFLPEFGGLEGKDHPEPGGSSSTQTRQLHMMSKPPSTPCHRHYGEIQVDGSTTGGDEIMSSRVTPRRDVIGGVKEIMSSERLSQENHGGNRGGGGSNTGIDKPLLGKKILVVEDTAVLLTVAKSYLSRLGATIIDSCENGKEAVELVSKSLRDQMILEPSMILPYDYIFMDCEMPIMDGYEATQMIRKEEKNYPVHIPIIALSAHPTGGEESNKMIKAGMDYHLTKPINKEKLLRALQSIHSE